MPQVDASTLILIALDHAIIVAIDASTTTLRAVAYSERGQELSMGRAALAVKSPETDAYEQDAEEWWTGLGRAIAEMKRGLSPEQVAEIAVLVIAHQRETVVVTDRKGTPLAPALLWMDSRCQREVARATSRLGAVRIHGLSGKPPCTTPSLYKLMHLFGTHPELRPSSFVHDVHSFLSLRLTGRAVSSFASADPSGLLDMRSKKWSADLLTLVGLRPDQLPELVEPGYLIGPLTPGAATSLGLPGGTLVYAGAGDGQAAGLGAGVTTPHRCYIEMATAVSAAVLTQSYQLSNAYRTLFSAVPGSYCLETTLRGGMQTLYWWLENQLGKKLRKEAMLELERQAEAIAAGSDGLLVLPYWAGVMSPHWDDEARGALIGLHHRHRPEHVYRAVLEGLSFELRYHLEGIEGSAGRLERRVHVLGGGSRSDLWCQILADVLDLKVVRTASAEATALGAALLGAVAHGICPHFEEAALEMTCTGEEFEPGPAASSYDRLYRGAYRGLYADIQSRLHVLAEFREAELIRPGETSPPIEGEA